MACDRRSPRLQNAIDARWKAKAKVYWQKNNSPMKAPSKRLPNVAAERLLAFLRDPRSYPGRPRSVQLIQTHASYLVLAGRHAYKVKKPVNFGFLDFSTLAKRHRICEREVALNRRLCPAIYLGVVPITLVGKRLRFGTGGRIVEYAVKMRRLPERYFMLRRMARGESGPRDVDAVVATLRPFYEAHEPTPEIAAWGRVSRLRISTRENFRQMERFVGEILPPAAFEAIRSFTNTFFRRHAPLFAARIRERRIRDCHGDLHLEHIHLGPAGVTIYDCIEFNDRFRYIDIASDVAFLAMDLDFHARPDLALRFTGRMAKALRDPGMTALLDFYKCYRACVRGKVEALRAVGPGVAQQERRESAAQATRYFQLALRYAVSGSKPTVLAVMGRVGSGKSTLARGVGEVLGWDVVSSDRLRKELAGVPLHRRGGTEMRRRLYAPAMTDRTYAALTRHALQDLRQHRGVIVDATFGSRRRRDRFRRVVARAGADCLFIEAQAPVPAIRKRLAARESSTAEISDARLDDWPMLDRGYEPPHEIPTALFVAAKTGRAAGTVVAAVLKALAARRAQA